MGVWGGGVGVGRELRGWSGEWSVSMSPGHRAQGHKHNGESPQGMK